MEPRNLINKEDITIGGNKYFISTIPAVAAQKIFLKAIGAFTSGSIADIPVDVLNELLSYAGAYNKAGGEVQFLDEDLINISVSDPMVLIEIEARMVEKNFGFLADGRLAKVMERMGKALTPRLDS